MLLTASAVTLKATSATVLTASHSVDGDGVGVMA
jgi:hypothetical protein